MNTDNHSVLRILHLEDNRKDRELVRETLSAEGVECEIQYAESRAEFNAAVENNHYDLILADHSLPGFDGVTALHIAREKRPETPFVFVTGSMGEERAIETMKGGATDYVLKHRLSRLSVAIRRAINEAREKRITGETVEKLAESERRFQLVARATNDAVWDWNILTGDLWFSSGIQNFGYSLGRMEGNLEFWLKNIHPEDRARVQSGLHDMLDSEFEIWTDEYRFRCADQSWAYVFDRGYVMRDENGKPLRMVGTIMDITERKENEERLREQATLLDEAREAIFVCDLDLRITYWNRGAERVYGWTAKEVIGKGMIPLIDKNSNRIAEARSKTIETGEWLGEVDRLSKAGKPLTVQGHWTLVKDERGEPKCFLIFNTDVTEKKQLENQFLRAQRMESIGILAGGIAHDLNNVLSPILMVAQLIRMKTDDPDIDEWLNTLEGSAKHGAELIRQILAFSRGVEGERVEMQVGHLIREIQKIISETFPRSITIRTDVAKDLWSIKGVATHLNQVLMNLCVNARDAMPGGGQIKISAGNVQVDEAYCALHPEARPGPYVVVSVNDTGTGIPPEVLERIYDPFFTTKEIGKGTGLGLSTVKGIIKSHHGFIHVYSEMRRGTTFKVYLPAEAAVSAEPMEKVAPKLPRGNGETILVVDDEAAVRNTTKLMLERYNYQIVTAADGAEGLALFVERRSDIRLVLTDMMMPIMDGRALIHALRKIDPSVRVIGLSGLMDSSQLEATPELRGVNLIAKPFSVEQLLTAVQGLLRPK